MSWKQAVEILESITTKMVNSAGGREWLARLENVECKDARRLGFCIAIDIASGALTPEDYASVLDTVDLSESCPRRAFALAFSNHPEREALICSSKLSSTTPDDEDTNIRILSLRDFITYYKKDRTLSPDDIAAVRTEYFSPYVPSDLSDIREVFGGANGVVWVMSRKEYDEMAKKYTGDDLATFLNDALGLGKEPNRSENDGRELVGVMYPTNFGVALQPTALDALWINFGWYYVSFGKLDGWGKTASCSGTKLPLRERVHKEIERLSAEFFGFPIGTILSRVIDRNALLDTADNRLGGILTATR